MGGGEAVGEDDQGGAGEAAAADRPTSSARSAVLHAQPRQPGGDAVERRRGEQLDQADPIPADIEGGGAERGQQSGGEADQLRRDRARTSSSGGDDALDRREQRSPPSRRGRRRPARRSGARARRDRPRDRGSRPRPRRRHGGRRPAGCGGAGSTAGPSRAAWRRSRAAGRRRSRRAPPSASRRRSARKARHRPPSGTVSTAVPPRRRAAGVLRGRRDRAVGDEQHPVDTASTASAASSALRAIWTRHPVAAQPADRGGERGRHALDEDDDRVGAGGGGEPRLALDHGAAGERQRRAQMARLARFVIGRDQRRKRHSCPLRSGGRR